MVYVEGGGMSCKRVIRVEKAGVHAGCWLTGRC